MAWPQFSNIDQLTINESPLEVVEIPGPAFGTIEDALSQLTNPPDLVGEGFIPMSGGYPLATRPTPTMTRQVVPIFIVPECDHTGAPLSPPDAEANYLWLREHVIDLPPVDVRPDGTRYVHLALRDGREFEGDCLIQQRQKRTVAGGIFCTIQFGIIRGSLAEVDVS